MAQVAPSRTHLYDSVDEFMDEAYSPEGIRNPANKRYWQQRKDYMENPDWFGMVPRRDGKPLSYLDVKRIVSDGWTEGLALIVERMDVLEVPWVPSVRRRMTWTDQGDHLEMPRVYGGQLDVAWQKGMRRESGGPRTVRIAVDNCYPAVAEPDQVIWRGVAAIAAAHALTEAGHSVELVTAFRTRDCEDGHSYTAQIRTKAATLPLDIGNVAATTAFSGFFRSTGLCWLWKRYENMDNGGCGRVEKLKISDVSPYGVTDRFLVPAGTDSQEAAQAWVKATVEQFCEGPNI